MSALWRVLLLISWLVMIRAEEICCCPDLNVRLQCSDSDYAQLDETGYRCVVLSTQTVTLQCDVADVDHSAIASVEYQYYRTYKINQDKPAPYEDAASVYKQLDCDAATCDVPNVQWLDWSDSSDADGLENYDNFAYMCLVEFTLIDGVSFNLTSNTMWLDVLHNDQSLKPDTVEQMDKTNINTGDPYEMLLCELPSTNPPTVAKWYKYNETSTDWDAIDVPGDSRMALVDDVIADESDDTFAVGTLVIMIFDPDIDEGLYKCNATYTPTLGESSEYTVSKYSITGNRQTYSGTPEVKMISAITSDEFTTVDGFVDFTCYARDTDAQDVGLYQWVFENTDANDEPLDVTTGRFESLELLNHDRTLRLPSDYDFYDIPFKCNVTRDDLIKVSQFTQPVIVPETLAIPDEFYQRSCFDRSENIKLYPNQKYMMGDDVEVTDYEQKLPGAGDKWFLNTKSISGFDATTADATELDMPENKFEAAGYGGEDSTWKCVYFSYLRTYTNKYQMLEVLKITRDDNCADLEDSFCTDDVEVTCNTDVNPQTLTVEITSGSAQCLSVELSKDGSSLATHQFEKTSTSCQGRDFTKTFSATDTSEEQGGLTGEYTATITPEGKVGCSKNVTCEPAICAKPTVEHGTLSPNTDTVTFGEAYDVTCDEGYILEGTINSMTCGAGGNFDQTLTCNASATCAKPTVEHGTVSPDTNTVLIEEHYTVACGDTYTMTGSPEMICKLGGEFDQTPNCTAVCDKPAITNGTVSPASPTIASGELYTVTCDEGYIIAGSAVMECGAGGTFQQTPQCTGAVDPEPVVGSKAGVVAGAVVGGVLGAIILTWLLLCLLKKAGVVKMKVYPDGLCDNAAEKLKQLEQGAGAGQEMSTISSPPLSKNNSPEHLDNARKDNPKDNPPSDHDTPSSSPTKRKRKRKVRDNPKPASETSDVKLDREENPRELSDEHSPQSVAGHGSHQPSESRPPRRLAPVEIMRTAV